MQACFLCSRDARLTRKANVEKLQSLSAKNSVRGFWKSKPSTQVAHSVSQVFAASASMPTIPGFAVLHNLAVRSVTTSRASDPQVTIKRSLGRWRASI